MRSHRASAIAA